MTMPAPLPPPVPRPPAGVHTARGSRTPLAALLAISLLAALAVVGATSVAIVALVAGHDDDGLAELTEAVEDLREGYAFGQDWYDEEYFPFEDAYVVLERDVTEATEDACRDLQDSAAALPFLGPDDPVAALAAVRDAVAAIIAAIDETGTLDRDSEAWRDDVQLLLGQLDDAVVVATEQGFPELDLTAGGDIAMRMFWGSPVGCEPPLRLLALDPDYPLLTTPTDSFTL